MKIALYDDHRIGIVEGELVFDVTAALPAQLDHFPRHRVNWLAEHFPEVALALRKLRAAAKPVPLQQVKLLPPSPGAGHVFAAPANYAAHIGELKERMVTKKGRTAREQGFFLKAPASLVGAGGVIELPRGSLRRFDHESELALIVGKGGRDIPRADAMDHVFGYACLIDATMRIEPGTGEEERSMRKSFAGFTPLGPWIVTADEVADPHSLDNRLWVNGELRQSANTRDMIVNIPELIELISSVLPLSPGDIIATGTPEGVGPIAPGDEVCIEIQHVGRMRLIVRERAAAAPRPY